VVAKALVRGSENKVPVVQPSLSMRRATPGIIKLAPCPRSLCRYADWAQIHVAIGCEVISVAGLLSGAVARESVCSIILWS